MRNIVCKVVSLVFITCVFAQGALSQNAPGQQAAIKTAVKKLVDEICSDGGVWLRCYSLEAFRCQEITTGFVEPCIKGAVMTPVAEPATQGVARILMCFNKRFMDKYGYGEVKSPECKNPMKHLSQAR